MRGQWTPLSISRRIIVDLMHFSRAVPTIPAQRRMHLGPLVTARRAAHERVPWTAIFAKAYALLAREMPELRRFYLPLPWPHFYALEASVANIVIERDLEGEKAVLAILLKDPASQTLDAVGARIRHAISAPVAQVGDFTRMLRIARLPRPLRRLIWWLGLSIGRQRANYFGTFAISVVSGLGADITDVRSPFPVLINYGVLDQDGAVDVRMIFDHRCMDGAQVARALARLEQVLLGPILGELNEQGKHA